LHFEEDIFFGEFVVSEFLESDFVRAAVPFRYQHFEPIGRHPILAGILVGQTIIAAM
jgi:hypothetical protein